jgi:2,3-bisphosphoglycerate-independent phosphoglycerate mutase
MSVDDKKVLDRPKPLVLLILDGFGWSTNEENNAIAMARTPNWDKLQQQGAFSLISCSGPVVGLPGGQMGNSEVGHLHIGAGRFLPQELSRVDGEITSGEFFSNPVLCMAVDQAMEKGNALHVLGLLSPGGVHSHERQIMAMVELAAKRGLKKIYVHAFLDGRDVPPKSAASSIELLEAEFTQLGVGKIASIAGRFYAMDRDNRWDRVEKAYNQLIKGEAEFKVDNAMQGLEDAYRRNETDEFVSPTIVLDEQQQAISIGNEDSVVFMNFRADRAREISRAITEKDFTEFERGHPAHTGVFATLTQYHEDFDYPVAYPPFEVKNGLGEVLSKLGLKQLRLSETEKYAHVTFFMNGGVEKAYPGEDRILIPSPKVKTYDLQPEMSAPEVTDKLVAAINEKKYDVIICNYANCDMVGHTGNLDAAVKAVEAVDEALGRLVPALQDAGGQMLLTADHGNIEKMVDEETGQPHTAHTTNKVPLVYFGGSKKLAEGGGLADLAPTMLEILGMEKPAEMTGRSLLVTE